MKKLLVLLTVLQLAVKLAHAQQDAQFSQYMFNGIYINPAYAGYKEQLNVSAFYRNQWTGVEGAPRTTSVAVDAIANDGRVGLALQLSDDELGAQRNFAGYANYAYRMKMNADGTSTLALGLGVGVVQLGINGALLNPNDPEMYQPVGMQTSTVPDARVGVYFSDDHFYAGLSADNLVSQYLDKDRYQFIPQPKPNFYLTAGLLVPLSEDIQLKPSFLLKDDRAGPTTLDLDVFIIMGDKLWIGGAYRAGVKLYNKPYLQNDLQSQNAAVAAIQICATSDIRIGYAYDFSIGPLQGYSGGTHELSISYTIPRRNDRMFTPRYF
jgi:type IX secretion system PorP/SprF family membrane protein